MTTIQVLKLAAIEQMANESGLSQNEVWKMILAGGNARDRFMAYVKAGVEHVISEIAPALEMA